MRLRTGSLLLKRSDDASLLFSILVIEIAVVVFSQEALAGFAVVGFDPEEGVDANAEQRCPAEKGQQLAQEIAYTKHT